MEPLTAGELNEKKTLCEAICRKSQFSEYAKTKSQLFNSIDDGIELRIDEPDEVNNCYYYLNQSMVIDVDVILGIRSSGDLEKCRRVNSANSSLFKKIRRNGWSIERYAIKINDCYFGFFDDCSCYQLLSDLINVFNK